MLTKVPSSQSHCFSSSHVRMWELDHKEGRVPENWCFWTVVLEKPLESPWESKEIKWVNPKENQPWILFGRTDAEAEASILCPPEEPTHWKRHWCWERLKPREDGDNRGWDGWMASPTQWTWVWINLELVTDREAWHAAVHVVTNSQTWLSDWTELMNGWLELSVILVFAVCIGLYRMIKSPLVVAESFSIEKLLICVVWQLAKFLEHLFGQVCKSPGVLKISGSFFTWSSSL